MGWIHSRGNDEARHCRFDAPSETEPSTEKHEWVTLGQKRIFQRDLAEMLRDIGLGRGTESKSASV